MRKFLLPALFLTAFTIGCSSSDESAQEPTAMNEDFHAKAACTNVAYINPSVAPAGGNNLLFTWGDNLIHVTNRTHYSRIEIKNAGCTGSTTVTSYPIDIFNVQYYFLSGGVDGGTGTDNCFTYRLVVESGIMGSTCYTATDWITYTP